MSWIRPIKKWKEWVTPIYWKTSASKSRKSCLRERDRPVSKSKVHFIRMPSSSDTSNKKKRKPEKSWGRNSKKGRTRLPTTLQRDWPWIFYQAERADRKRKRKKHQSILRNWNEERRKETASRSTTLTSRYRLKMLFFALRKTLKPTSKAKVGTARATKRAKSSRRKSWTPWTFWTADSPAASSSARSINRMERARGNYRLLVSRE